MAGVRRSRAARSLENRPSRPRAAGSPPAPKRASVTLEATKPKPCTTPACSRDPALDGVAAKLTAGATVADVGCGHGASAVVMAQAYPAARITGFDSHAPSVDTARKRAADAGVADRTSFEVSNAKSCPGTYDLICFFDCLHDTGDPVGAARFAREHLTADGTVLLVEPFAIDDQGANLTGNPMAALLYTASSAICTPNSLSQEVGLGLGAQAGETRLRKVLAEAGFTRFRRAAETPKNLILEARP